MPLMKKKEQSNMENVQLSEFQVSDQASVTIGEVRTTKGKY